MTLVQLIAIILKSLSMAHSQGAAWQWAFACACRSVRPLLDPHCAPHGCILGDRPGDQVCDEFRDSEVLSEARNGLIGTASSISCFLSFMMMLMMMTNKSLLLLASRAPKTHQTQYLNLSLERYMHVERWER